MTKIGQQLIAMARHWGRMYIFMFALFKYENARKDVYRKHHVWELHRKRKPYIEMRIRYKRRKCKLIEK